MSCPSCGKQNPTGSLFCQGCGQRLEPAAAAGGGDSVRCGRCGAVHEAGMRFCTECGHRLEGTGGPVAGAVAAPAAPMAASHAGHGGAPAAGAALSPGGQIVHGTEPAPAPEVSPQMRRLEKAVGGPVCGRCRGVGDPGTAFCKFCGVPYGATPAGGAAAFGVTAQGPQDPDASVSARVDRRVTARAWLVAILKDGSDGQSFPLSGPQCDIGRSEGDVVLNDDPYLSPRHARICVQGDTITLRDLDSVNGVYCRIRDSVELRHGDMILIGQQVLRFETLEDGELPLGPASVRGVLVFGTPETPRVARLVQYTTEGVGRDVHYLYRDETVLGRETGHIVFADDGFMSRRHAAITIDRASRRFTLRDMGSSNGSAIRVRGELKLSHGDEFRVGRHLFRFDLASGGAGGRSVG